MTNSTNVLDWTGTVGAVENRAGRRRGTVSWTIDKVISERAIRTLFQPIVHLETKAIVGFEALSRGPEGSELESPMALLEAAAAAGRLGELDWLCRVLAMKAACDSELPPSLAWFINVEPASLDTPCPEYLLQEFTLASANLRVIFEFVERDIQENVATVLNAADDVRDHSWGVALDDVGAIDGSLAVMPLVQPDVVKLDRCLLDSAEHDAAIPVVTAVLAYAERRGAAILAEGIETDEEEAIAAAFGAEFVQGFRYGRPGSLPESIPAVLHVVPIRQNVAPTDDETPFETLSTQIPARSAAESEIAYISAWLQQQATADEPGVAKLNFRETPWATSDNRHTLQQVVDGNVLTLVTAGDLPDGAESNQCTTVLDAANPMSREWIVIVLRPHFAVAFAARNRGQWAGTDPRFDYVLTHNRDLAVTAARALLQGIDRGPTSHWLARRPEAKPQETPLRSAANDPSVGAAPRLRKPRRLCFRSGK